MHYELGSYGVKDWGKHGPPMNPYAFGFFEHMKQRGRQAPASRRPSSFMKAACSAAATRAASSRPTRWRNLDLRQ